MQPHYGGTNAEGCPNAKLQNTTQVQFIAAAYSSFYTQLIELAGCEAQKISKGVYKAALR